MRHRGCNFPAAAWRQIPKEGSAELSPDVGKGIAVEKEEGCSFMEAAEEIQGLRQR
jgi:hypothetical protein